MNSRFVKERKGPGFIGSDKAPAIRERAVHRIVDTKVGMSATNKRRRPRSSKPRKRSLDE